MIGGWEDGLLIFFRTFSQILTAGIAITAFSLLLYALTFNLRDRVARSFALILICVVIAFTTEAIGSAVTPAWEINTLLRIQWVGIILLPATYLQFSDALLATTGKPSRGRRIWAVRLAYLISVIQLFLLTTPWFIGPLVLDQPPAPHLQPTFLTDLFSLYYLVVMGMSWYNFARAYRRTTTPTSRRRMNYLIISALAPAFGSFPYLLFGSQFAGEHPLIFWVVAALSNLLLGSLVVAMAYAVAFFGVSWPDRVVKSRLFKWIMRGPVTACVALGLTTFIRRTGAAFGTTYTALVPIGMVGSIVIIEYLITLFSPLWERWLFYGNDAADLQLLHSLEERLLSRNDLRQFLEMILAAVCDRLQAPGAYVAAMKSDTLELVVTTGKTRFDAPDLSSELFRLVSQNHELPDLFQWGDDYLVPLLNGVEEGTTDLLGLLGISRVGSQQLDDEQLQALSLLADRAALALKDRRIQQQIFQSIQMLTPQMELIERIRAAGRYESSNVLLNDASLPSRDMAQWVKEALTHYWGGPKLTESPLMKLQVVQAAAVNSHEGNYANALRAILKEAIERVRPEGERRFTAEWILYNILEMKFLEGRKVREIALRLALSEADLYRKQRVAVEAVARAILEMEAITLDNQEE
jgi:hypothetical protein